MSENQIKDRIIEELKKTKEAGKITGDKVREIVKSAVSAAGAELKGSAEELRPVVKDRCFHGPDAGDKTVPDHGRPVRISQAASPLFFCRNEHEMEPV